MDVKQFADQLKNRMVDQIEAIRQAEKDELVTWAKITQVTREICLELKQFLRDQIIEDQAESILLNKEIRPFFLSRHFFHLKVFEFELDASISDSEDTLKQCKIHLQQISNFQLRHKNFYNYIKSGSTYLDDQYFSSRSSQNRRVAIFLAYDAFKDYMKNKMETSSYQNKIPFNIAWTGSKTDLVELVYALQANKCIDHGKIHLTALVPSRYLKRFSIPALEIITVHSLRSV